MNKKVLLFAGSIGSNSYNRQLISHIANLFDKAGLGTEILELSDLPLPIICGDVIANGIPENAKRVTDLIIKSDAVFISSPEYNLSLPPLLKNLIDWVSVVNRQAFDGKVCGTASTSPSNRGGMIALQHLRSLLNILNARVSPGLFTVSDAKDAFNNGVLVKENDIKNAQRTVDDILTIIGCMHGK